MLKRTKYIINPDPECICAYCCYEIEECSECGKEFEPEEMIYHYEYYDELSDGSGIYHLCRKCAKEIRKRRGKNG